MTGPAFQRMTVEEYLRTEAKSPYKREYVAGFVYPLRAQAGTSDEHAPISMNIGGTLYRDAMQAGCRLYLPDIKLFVEEGSSFVSPDVMLVCWPKDGGRYFKTAPGLLVEVLSSSTASNDRVGKYAVYTSIPSLQTYLIVEQAERRVYAYTRQGEKWALDELIGEGAVEIACLGEIYAGVL